MFNFNKNNITRAIVNNLKIRTKLLIVYFTIVAVTVLTVGVYLTILVLAILKKNKKIIKE